MHLSTLQQTGSAELFCTKPRILIKVQMIPLLYVLEVNFFGSRAKRIKQFYRMQLPALN